MNKKNKLFDHIALKILALLISFVLWIVVTNIADPTTTKNIQDIPVEMLNADTIAGDNKVFDITGGKTVSIWVKGPRSVVEDMSESSFVATADLSQLSVANSTTINVQPSSSVKPADAKKISIIKINNYVTLSIDEAVEKTIPVVVKTDGKALSGRAIGKATATPDAITVTGPATVLANVVEARAFVDVNGIGTDMDLSVDVGLVDGYGAAVETDNIDMSVSEVRVSIPVYNTKTIPVNVATKGDPADGYKIRKIQYNPSDILICGEQEDLKEISSIEIDDIYVTSATENIDKSVNVNDYLPEGIYVVDEAQNVIALSVKIEKMVEKPIPIEKESIDIQNKNPDYKYEIKSQDLIEIKLFGFQEHIADITLEQLDPSINVADLEPGEYELTIAFKDSETFVVKGTYSVTVEVKEKDE
ncbi:MAG: hypothetical protein J5684_08230 [Eubacterium sp.]|nr:hypothetical protein [Eubacterium sp.]